MSKKAPLAALVKRKAGGQAMICQKCGLEIPEESRNCPYCGAPVAEPPQNSQLQYQPLQYEQPQHQQAQYQQPQNQQVQYGQPQNQQVQYGQPQNQQPQYGQPQNRQAQYQPPQYQPPQYQQPPYGQQYYAQPVYGARPEAPGNGLCIAGMVCGILSLLFLCSSFLSLVPAILGIVLSAVGLSKAKKAGVKNGMAIAGLVTSSLALVIDIALIVLLLVFGLSAFGTYDGGSVYDFAIRLLWV